MDRLWYRINLARRLTRCTRTDPSLSFVRFALALNLAIFNVSLRIKKILISYVIYECLHE